ncbi:MAG: DUF3105 domain-containing protein [Ardenticatenaceae bacterium]|nr:DUF3105 domain-containing protein [Anaerolineales bacterium]MCB8941835.1 DUF3105 domain-containing protein [Ardenticatenaceae bacterium]MCB8972949.1 DUF3105 domain-containing protein [Ardenticatenaceae bacterium]
MSKTSSERKRSKRDIRREQMAREKRMKALRLWVPVGVVVLAIVGLLIYRGTRPELEGVTVVAAAVANQHDDTLEIPFGGTPPMGGPHAPVWQNCGIYDTPVAGQYAIHSMEHGAVWMTYNPDLPADQVVALQAIASGDPYMLLNPYPDQSSPIVLTVWDRQLAVDSAADPRIEQFIDQYQQVRAPESGAACTGGVGTPIG